MCIRKHGIHIHACIIYTYGYYVTHAHITIALGRMCVRVCVCIRTILSCTQCSTIIVVVIIITIIVSKGWARRAFNDYCPSVYIYNI